MIFLVCANYNAAPSSASKWDSGQRPAAAAGKRLHNLALDAPVGRGGGHQAAAAAHAPGPLLPSNRGVKFIGGDPSRPRKELPSPKPRVSDDEVDYYKAKNR